MLNFSHRFMGKINIYLATFSKEHYRLPYYELLASFFQDNFLIKS